MEIYIIGAQTLSPHDTFLTGGLPRQVETFHSIMKFRLPDYKNYFTPIQRRRMSNLIKASSVCSTECVNESGVNKPDAIIVASSLGSIEESEKFLNKMIDEKAEFLTPTNFIQSNLNSLSAQIALNYQSNSYNVVYSHKSASFESALLDAFMLISDNVAQNVLVGGIDEITTENYELKKNIGLWKEEPFSNLDILKSSTPGSIPGEGVSFFMLSLQKKPNAYAQFKGVSVFPFSDSVSEIQNKLYRFVGDMGIDLSQIDLVLTGNNGDKESDAFTQQVLDVAFPKAIHGLYKHLCGEYDTASSFGLWFASHVMREGKIPEYARLNQIDRNIKNSLIYHHDGFRNHSFILLQAVNSAK